jgi:hypothetical protein
MPFRTVTNLFAKGSGPSAPPSVEVTANAFGGIQTGPTYISGLIIQPANVSTSSILYANEGSFQEVTIQIAGGGNGSFAPQVSNDGVTWTPPMYAWRQNGGIGGYINQANSATFMGYGTGETYRFGVAGFLYFRIFTNNPPTINARLTWMASTSTGPLQPDITDGLATTDAVTIVGVNCQAITESGSTRSALAVGSILSTGSSTAGVMQRTPNIFRGAQFSAAGANVVWMPPSTKKVRLMKYKIEVSADATITGGAAPINLQWAQQLGAANASFLPYGTLLPYTHRVVVPSAAQSSFLGYDSGWIDLGNGVLGPTAGRALQMGIQVPQSTAAITSPTWAIASNQWEAATVGFKTNSNTGNFRLVQQNVVGNVASLTTFTAVPTVQGNSIFVIFRTTNVVGGAPTVTVTDTALNTYTTGTLVTNASDNTNGSSIGVAYCINAVGNSSNTVVVTTSTNLATQVAAIYLEYSGTNLGGIDAAQVGTTGNSASPASGAYTPSTAGDLVLTFMGTDASLAALPTAPVAFTLRGGTFSAVIGTIAVADNFGNGSLATGQINVIACGTEE